MNWVMQIPARCVQKYLRRHILINLLFGPHFLQLPEQAMRIANTIQPKVIPL
jgi:hypothetical protein